MGKQTIPPGETKKLASGSQVNSVKLTVKGSEIAVAGRRKNASAGQRIPPQSIQQVELEEKEDLFAFNVGKSQATVNVVEG